MNKGEEIDYIKNCESFDMELICILTINDIDNTLNSL